MYRYALGIELYHLVKGIAEALGSFRGKSRNKIGIYITEADLSMIGLEDLYKTAGQFDTRNALDDLMAPVQEQNEREKGLGSFSPILGVGRSSGQALCLLLLLFHLHFGRRVVLADDVFSSSTSFLEVGSVLL